MAKSLNQRLALMPGLEYQFQKTSPSSRLRIDPGEGEFGYFPASLLAGTIETIGLGSVSDLIPYSTALWVETKDNSATVMPASNGLKLQGQATPTANDDVAINGVRAVPLVQDKFFVFSTQLQVSSVNASTGAGLTAGIVANGSSELFTADPPDGVFFKMATGGGALIGRVTENGNAPNDVSLLTLAAGSDYRLGFAFKCGASAATSFGIWYAGPYASETPGAATPFTSAQTTALYNMLATSPPSLSAHLGMRHTGTTQRNLVAQYVLAFGDR